MDLSNQIKGYTLEEDCKKFQYYTPNSLCEWRVKSFYSKEPHTVEWIKRIQPNECLLDVGANIGMYSIYAAATRGCHVEALEPESQNFSVLCKNIYLNQLQDLIFAYPIACSNKTEVSKLHLSNFRWEGGDSCHSAGHEVDFKLKQRRSSYSQGTYITTIDTLIQSNSIRQPNFLKIDVDGLEHLVINGALNTLKNSNLKSICIEINTDLKEHQTIIKTLEELDFVYCREQVTRAKRSTGHFAGCAEFIFDRSRDLKISMIAPFQQKRKQYCTNKKLNTQKHQLFQEAEQAFESAIDNIINTEVAENPFPYLFVNELFPREYYQKILDYFPQSEQLTSIVNSKRVGNHHEKLTYKERNILQFNDESFDHNLTSVSKDFWTAFSLNLSSKKFVESIVKVFRPYCVNRLASVTDKNQKLNISCDTILVSDTQNYSIGPHTDHPKRLLSLLFYCPNDKTLEKHGTSLYRPKKENYLCDGFRHHLFENFENVSTMPFHPNHLLIFPRTSNSFHGVEALDTSNINRNLLITNYRLDDYKLPKHMRNKVADQPS